MKLRGKMLPEWLTAQDPKAFPSGRNYLAGYPTLVTHLNEHVHKKVTPTNIHIDSGYLTDHGPDHIEKLIERMGALLTATEERITPYEVYILLVAAQFHDVGNIFGRERHEEKSATVMQDAGTLLGIDSVEQRCIYRIAQAHGGEERDKLSKLPKLEHIQAQPVRSQLLAAVLKFGDELAEDSQRAARYPRAKGLLPPESEIYHAYAESLNSVVVDGPNREIMMRFDLSRKQALKTFLKKGKAGQQDKYTYLIDEIFARTVKTHFERVYCSRFLRPFINLDAISVTIEVTTDSGFAVLERITYRLEEAGYPDAAGQDIHKLCPNLGVTGASLAASLVEKKP